MILAAVVRLRLLGVPLERDEGEFAYMGQLLLQGIPPYAEAYNMKMPGIYAAYALIMAAFGQTCAGIRLGLLFVHAATTAVLFLLAKRLLGTRAALVSVCSFVMVSLSQSVLGAFAQAEHFVILCSVAGLFLLIRSRGTLFAGALLLGTGFLMKQHGAAFIAMGAFILGRRLKEPRACAVFLCGVILPFALTCLILALAGVFSRFWFWTFTYAYEYATATSLREALLTLADRLPALVSTTWPWWVLAGFGAASLLQDKKLRPAAPFLAAFLGFSVLSILPGFYFTRHYFLLLLPAAALLAGAGFVSRPALAIALLLLASARFLWAERDYLFRWDPATVSRMTYGENPFPETVAVAKYIEANTSPRDCVAVIGSEPEIYFYSKRRSCTGYIYAYPLMESHPYALQMQKDMIREIEARAPKILVFVAVPNSWARTERSETLLLRWLEDYEKGYEQVGLVKMAPPLWISILKRKAP
ncbi:MAG: glycosyltransferase family 39 protein [Elusimicrobiota bacterium]